MLVLTWCEGDDVNAHGQRVMKSGSSLGGVSPTSFLKLANLLPRRFLTQRNSFALSVNPTVVGAVHDDFITEEIRSLFRRILGGGGGGEAGHGRRRQTASVVKESADVGEEVALPLARSIYPS